MSEKVRMIGGAALLIALAAVPGAHAQRLTAEPIISGLPAGPLPSPAPVPPAARNLLPAEPGLAVSGRTWSGQDGSTVTRRGLIGSWSVAPDVEAGVGLFSVTGDGRKHNEFRRTWSYRDVAPRNENIAAIGVKLKF